MQETLAKLTQRQSAFLRRAVEPATSAWLQQHAVWAASLETTMLGSIGISGGLQDVGNAFAGRLPKFELSLPNLSAFTELHTNRPALTALQTNLSALTALQTNLSALTALQTNLSALTAVQTSVSRLVRGIDFGAIRRALGEGPQTGTSLATG